MKWYWIFLLGAAISYFIHKTSSTYGWIAGAVTLLLTFLNWKKG